MIPRYALVLSILAITCATAPAAEAPVLPPLRMNQIQVMGTHNSYHLRPAPDKMALLSAFTQDAESWDYEHLPLPEQLSNGIRSFELDLQAYPGGWEVFHVPTLDEGSSCPRFVDCLEQVKSWSGQHPNHVPICFLMEIKEKESVLSVREMLPLTEETLATLDKEILSVFPKARIITPDEVRGSATTLAEGVRTTGWPALDAARGRVMFILHERGELRDLYTQGTPSLEGKILFVNSSPQRADGACIVLDNASDPRIPEVVKAGMFVRTRVGSGREKDTSRSEKALTAGLLSGVHILSTDAPRGEPNSHNGYVAELPGGVPARVNPVNAPPHDPAAPLE